MSKKWSQSETDFLINNYSKLSLKQIAAKLNRSVGTVQNQKFKLKKLYPDNNLISFYILNKADHKAEKLLNDTNEAFYWVGLLLADGHFDQSPNKTRNRIKLCLKDIDKDRVVNLHKFLELRVGISYYSDRTTNYAEFSVVHKEKIRPICEKFDIKSRKTENPPDLSIYENFNDDLLLALIIGYIDGDGSINKKGSINIKVHKNWLGFLDLIQKKINSKLNATIPKPALKPQKNKKGVINFYAKLNINQTTSRKLKQFIIDNNLDVMKRKWDRVKLSLDNPTTNP